MDIRGLGKEESEFWSDNFHEDEIMMKKYLDSAAGAKESK